WGAFGGLLPDLDILAYPFLDTVGELYVHRGFTHGVLFPFIAAPLLAWLAVRIHGSENAGFKRWVALFFLAILTHPILDALTVYGTGLLEPFSTYRVAWNSIFIIDPAYTVPLFIGLAVAVFSPKTSRRRRLAISIGFALSTLYLAWGLVAKSLVHEPFESAAEAQGIDAVRMMTVPMPLNSILWRAVVEDTEGNYHVAFHSLLDDPARPIPYSRIEGRHSLIEPWHGTRGTEAVRWFSKGWYAVEPSETVPNTYAVYDIRFGRFGFNDGPWVFTFELSRPTPDAPVTLSQRPQGTGDADLGDTFAQLWQRILGN
ncbi:MAG: metal-dependent hydrolase, partial [Bacteroidota bacterium]